MLQRLCVLGSTGSIGDGPLDVVARNSDAFVVYASSAHRNMRKLFQQCSKPDLAGVGTGRFWVAIAAGAVVLGSAVQSYRHLK
ncbi:hypothetical protein [Pseudomonas sp. GM102]|uniref:hypothetical protein n=1 Tax=Pseudomonas sp. GM102 TaxID=1144321 RepID=UPI0009DA4DE2|nr:hypothetical protein [Pseudomonas sp. GM102]